ncbi:MAG: glycosyltransferase [Acidobacteriota bacterium]|nr:glycosyltransferase [Acidobacteriota bacterium]
MRILYFSPRDCWPLTTGARLRDYHLARQLALRADVTYIGFASDPLQRRIARTRVGADGEIDQITVPRGQAYSAGNILRGVLGPLPVPVLNYTTAAMAGELTRLLNSASWDLVQMEGVHLHSYIPAIRGAASRPRLVCDWHNIESELMGRYSGNHATPLPKRLYGQRTAMLLRHLEGNLLKTCDAHLVCCERERGILLQRGPKARIHVAGNGVDVSFYSHAEQAAAAPNVVFAGSMDYHANIDGALYFAKEIWPLVRSAMPAMEFFIVGSRPVPEVKALAGSAGITVTDTVPDMRPYYRNATAVVVPLRVGSGTRLKVLEAMAAGVPVISTPLGAEGIEFTEGRDLLTAESPRAFADAVLKVVNDATLRRSLAVAGSNLVRAKYDWEIIGSRLFDFYAQ